MHDFIYILESISNNDIPSVIGAYTNFYKLKQDLLKHPEWIKPASGLCLTCCYPDSAKQHTIYHFTIVESSIESQRSYQDNQLKRLNAIDKLRQNLVANIFN